MKLKLPNLVAVPEISKRGSSMYWESPMSPMRGRQTLENTELDFFKGSTNVKERKTDFNTSLSKTFLNNVQNSVIHDHDFHQSALLQTVSVGVGPSMLSNFSARMQNQINNKEKRQTKDNLLI